MDTLFDTKSEHVTTVSCNTGDYLFRQGAEPRGLYRLDRGRLRLVRTLNSGVELTVQRVDSGQTFAHASLFSSSYHCDAIADADCLVAMLNRDFAISTLEQEPGFALQFAKSQAGEIQRLRTMLEICRISSAEDRVMAWLDFSAEADTVVLDRTIKTLATEIGMSSESLYRTLSKLAAKNRIERDANSIRIIQTDA